MIKVGDFVRHKNVPTERLQVFKVNDGIATVLRLDEPKIWYAGRQVEDYQKYICDIINLTVIENEPEKGQLKMF